MDYQFWIVIVMLLLASCYLLACGYSAWRKLCAGGCSSGCGCAGTTPQQHTELVQPSDLTAKLTAQKINVLAHQAGQSQSEE